MSEKESITEVATGQQATFVLIYTVTMDIIVKIASYIGIFEVWRETWSYNEKHEEKHEATISTTYPSLFSISSRILHMIQEYFFVDGMLDTSCLSL